MAILGTDLSDNLEIQMAANRLTADYALGEYYFLMPAAGSVWLQPFDKGTVTH